MDGDQRERWIQRGFNGLAIVTYIISVASVIFLLAQTSAQVTSIWPLLFVVAIAPGLLSVVVFAAYRVSYRRDEERQAQRILAWHRYALPLSILMSFSTFFSATLLWEEIVFSRDEFRSGFAFGLFSIPLYFNGIQITSLPSTIFWGAYGGFMVIFMSATLMRFVNKSLVPHFYLGSAFRLISGLLGACLWWLVLHMASSIIPLNESKVVDPYVTILGAFVVGATTNDFINFVISRVGRIMGLNIRQELSLSEVQGIDPTLAVYLQDEGITTIQVLATASREFLQRITAVDEATMFDWRNQALFLRSLPSHEVVDAFHALGFNELKDLADQFLDVSAPEALERRFQELAEALVVAGQFREPPYTNPNLFIVMLRNLYNEHMRGEVHAPISVGP